MSSLPRPVAFRDKLTVSGGVFVPHWRRRPPAATLALATHPSVTGLPRLRTCRARRLGCENLRLDTTYVKAELGIEELPN